MDVASLFVFLSLIGFLDATRCPSDEDMAPCKCHLIFSGQEADVRCKNILNSEELFSPMQALAKSGTKIYNLMIETSSLLYLPENLFRNTHISMVSFLDTEIRSLSESDTAFNGLENTLGTLKVINYNKEITTASQWDFSQLRNLHKLSHIWVHKVILGAIDHEFPHLPELDRLFLERAEISFIADDAFSNLPKLFYIDLHDNDISEMKRTMFPNPAEKLDTINLSRNKLSYLPKDFFDNMPSLSNVYLDKNEFQTLAEKPFSVAIGNLATLSMSENPFRCDCRMRWLVDVRLPSTFKGKCSSPTALSGKNIKDLDLKSLLC